MILHYCALESTIEAVESIRKCSIDAYDIVIVDNASPDQSGIILKQRYGSNPKIHMILNGNNEGFARGNNVGYRYARETLEADFIVVMNNDVVLEQVDFAERVLSIYQECRFDVLGPDIVTPDGKHRNPHRLQTFSDKDLRRIIRNRSIILFYLRIKKLLGLTEKIQFIEKWDEKRGEEERKDIGRDTAQKNVVLQGSCFVFSPDFVEKEQEAFWPETFMWLEEEILTYLCQKKNYTVLYQPEITVIHKEEISTKESQTDQGRYFFFSQQLKNSARVMLKLMKQFERE